MLTMGASLIGFKIYNIKNTILLAPTNMDKDSSFVQGNVYGQDLKTLSPISPKLKILKHKNRSPPSSCAQQDK